MSLAMKPLKCLLALLPFILAEPSSCSADKGSLQACDEAAVEDREMHEAEAMKVELLQVRLQPSLAAGAELLYPPSTMPNCPSGYVNCGYCPCAPPGICQHCVQRTTAPLELLAEQEADAAPAHAPESQNSTLSGCPAAFVSCGYCPCVPAGICQYCPSPQNKALLQAALTVEAVTEPTYAPSTLPGCPAGFVNCGWCPCAPPGICQHCAQRETAPVELLVESERVADAAPAQAPEYQNATLSGCPAAFVSCGYCPCVPAGICQYCPAPRAMLQASSLSSPSTSELAVGSPIAALIVEAVTDPTYAASTLPGCPAGFVNCGWCPCAPPGICQHCAQRETAPVDLLVESEHLSDTALVQAPEHQNSTLSGCPAAFVSCGSCPCVPAGICQYCPGPAALLTQEVTGPSYPASTVPGCPAGYVNCGYCPCAPPGICQQCTQRATAPIELLAEHVADTGADTSSGLQPQYHNSTLPGCPAAFVSCGYCPCVPGGVCQFCPA